MDRDGLQKLAELERHDKPYHVVLDLDRTLFMTNKFVDYIYDVLGYMGIKQIEQFQQHEKANRGNTLDILQELEAYFTDVFSFDAFKAAMDKLEKPQLIYSGVRELLLHFKEQGTSFSIMTYGGESTQALKLLLFFDELGPELNDIPSEITSVEKNKADYIDRAWADGRGHFTLPAYISREEKIVDEIVVVDDKSSNFVTTNPSIIGLHVSYDANPGTVTAQDIIRALEQ